MSFLLDTNIISEVRKARPDPAVTQWVVSTADERQFISAITIGELRRGAAGIRRRDPAQAAALDAWVDRTIRLFGERTLPVTTDVADAWGTLVAGRSIAVPDGLIAATALVEGLAVVTRNVKHFEGLGVRVVNPFPH